MNILITYSMLKKGVTVVSVYVFDMLLNCFIFINSAYIVIYHIIVTHVGTVD